MYLCCVKEPCLNGIPVTLILCCDRINYSKCTGVEAGGAVTTKGHPKCIIIGKTREKNSFQVISSTTHKNKSPNI